MNNQPRIPDPETIKRHVSKMREVCRQFDALNLLLDEAIAQVEADIKQQSTDCLSFREGTSGSRGRC